DIRSDFRMDAPLYGCVLALTVRVAPRTVSWWNSTAVGSGMLAVAGTGGLAAWVGLRVGRFFYPGTGASIVCLLGVMLLISQIGSEGQGSSWLTWRPLVAIGQVSYGIYLWQQLFLGPSAHALGRLRAFPNGLPATFMVAVASYLFLEKPFLRLKDRKFHKRES